MQRMDFRGNDFVSHFRSSDPTPGTLLPSILPTLREDALCDSPSPVQDAPPTDKKASTPILPPRRKNKFHWWQLLFYVPWLLWMFGHDLWRDRHPAPNTTLIQAAQDGNMAQVTSALSHGASVNAECGCNRSALSWSSLNGHIAVASLLISRGAAVNSVDDHGDSALTLAAWQRHTDIVALLVAHNADVNHINGQGGTALWSAVQHGQIDMAGTLLARHADPNVAGKRRWTMLMDAARGGSLPMVEMLVRHGARVNTRSLDGETAYGEALRQHRGDIADVLRKAGAVSPARVMPPAPVVPSASVV